MSSDEGRALHLPHVTRLAALNVTQSVRTGHVIVTMESPIGVAATNLTLDQVRELRDWLTASLPEPLPEPDARRVACRMCGTPWVTCREWDAAWHGRPRCCTTCAVAPNIDSLHPLVPQEK